MVAVLLGACSSHATRAVTAGPVSVGPTTAPSGVATSEVATTSAVAATTSRPAPTTPASARPTTSRPTARSTTTKAAPSRAAPPTTGVAQPGCPVNLAGQLASTGGATQLVTVDAPSDSATTATVMLWQRAGSCWVAAGGPWAARVGRNGLSAHHREGDGTTPTGGYRLSPVMYGIAADPGVHGSYHQLVCGDWWDEDPQSPQYNSFQHVACGTTPPFGANSEALWTETTAAQRFAVVEYNTSPVVVGAGSGIFIHGDIGGPTNGCVALAAAQLDTLLRWLQPALAPRAIIGADAEIRQF